MINKKILILGVLIVLLAVLVFLLQEKPDLTGPEEQQKTIIKIGCWTGDLHLLPFFVAQKAGIFDEYNLEVQLKQMESTVSTAALLKGEIDYSIFIREGTMAILKGTPLRAVMSFYEKPFPYLLNAQPGINLNDIKTIGITYPLSPSHYVALKAIEENDLPAEIVIAGGSGQVVFSLLETKRVDALVTPVNIPCLQFDKTGTAPIVQFIDHDIPSGLTTTENKIRNNPEEVERLIKALLSAIKFIKDNPEKSKEILFESYKLDETDVNQKVVEEILPRLKNNLSETGAFSNEEIDTLIKIGKTGAYETLEDVEKQIVTDEDIATVFDFRFVK